MTTLLDRIETGPTPADTPAGEVTAPAQRLRATMAACRVQFTWLGTQKALTPEQRAAAAEAFDAEGRFLSATKRLLDTAHPAYRAVTAVRGKISEYWRSLTLPFPEPGVRLIRQEKLAAFAAAMDEFQAELECAVRDLDGHYAELRRAAAARLGSLYNPADYPETLVGLFAVAYDFPSVEPPEYLMQLSPTLYAAERERVRGRFEEAVRLAEAAFLDEFAKLVEHLTERITGAGEDGQPKVFRDSAVNNLVEFFQRFRELNVRSNPQLDELVERAQRVVRGVAPQDLRDSAAIRQRVADSLGQVRLSLDALLVDRPRRRILRQAGTGGA
jgi:hypothetical protein